MDETASRNNDDQENIKTDLKVIDHHQQQELCVTRPMYRKGKRLTAVKTYTVATESQHLFIYGVPKINLRNEIKKLCSKYGSVSSIHVVVDHKTDIFTECYHVVYDKIQIARFSKRFLDNRSFFGSILHVCYAPEYETIEETKQKLNTRLFEILKRTKS